MRIDMHKRLSKFVKTAGVIIDENQNDNTSKSESDLVSVELNVTAVSIAVGLIIIIIIIGFCGNLLTILAVKTKPKLQTISNVFIVNLSVCDIIDLCCVLPFNLYTYIVDGWFLNEHLCKFVGFLGYTVTGTTIITITLIAYNRYKLVLDPAAYKLLYTKTNVLLMVLATWIIPAICLVPAVCEVWGKFGYVPMLVTCNLSLDHGSQLFKLFLLTVRAIIPCILIIYFYIMIFQTTHASHLRLNSIRGNSCSPMEIHNHKKEMHLTKMMVIIFVVFIISYFPCTVTGIIDWDHVLSKDFHIYCAISIYITSTINPFIYGLMNRQFKKAFKEILPCFKGQPVKHQNRQDMAKSLHRFHIVKLHNRCAGMNLVLISSDKNSSSNSKSGSIKSRSGEKTSCSSSRKYSSASLSLISSKKDLFKTSNDQNQLHLEEVLL